MINKLKFNYKRYFISNGLEVILYRDSSIPIIDINIWYRVGSSVEKKGKTGLAHLFEHMMFQGSAHIPKGMHFKHIQEAGGTLNGSTSFDRTNYYEKLPSNYLELALWLESDRMGFLLPSIDEEKLKNQIDVVKNERLERYDNQPYGLAWEKIFSTLYSEDHPYHSPTIGWMNDILNYSIDDVKDFFTNYYSPANATLVVAGNFEEEKAINLIQKYFGEIPNKFKSENIKAPNFLLERNIEMSYKDNVQLERIYLVFQTDKIFSEDDTSLDILSNILTGTKNSRLNKKLVFDKQSVVDVSSFQFSGKYGGFFCVVATAKPGVPLEQIKTDIFSEFKRILSSGIEKDELERVKNLIKSGFIFSLQSIDYLADQLNHYNFYLGEPDSFQYDYDRYISCNEEKVKQVVQKYLTGNYLELRVLPNQTEN